MRPFYWLANQAIGWLTHQHAATDVPQCDFERLSFEIRPCDVLLIEGRSRVSDVIKTITQSQWTHSALYIGRLHDIEDPVTREHLGWLYDGDPNDQLVIEPLLGKGTIISPLKDYAGDHVRICRPTGLTRPDVGKVVAFAAKHLGHDYDVRQMLDLARFLFPYGILPRRWRSSLFEHNIGLPTRTICSTMIAAAFSSIHFPILPVARRTADGTIRLFKRNTRLYVPRDFDTSPYFQIIKYPMLGLDDIAVYRQLPWDTEGVVCNDETECFLPGVDGAAPVLMENPGPRSVDGHGPKNKPEGDH
ncbi:MAG: YiiX/YebB-like N1pC/P60 family cysteine hydrolase [Gammaproteobacteria bacterium]|nr:YiiX/YebB-like N1pC/P60 family cysteine hydrolase [Gammaproteobacteria bacterium]